MEGGREVPPSTVGTREVKVVGSVVKRLLF